jgi:hypothetical protein
VIGVWLVRAEAVRDGSLMIAQETISDSALRVAGFRIGEMMEARVRSKLRRRFSIEPDAVYWQLEQHIEMSSDD